MQNFSARIVFWMGLWLERVKADCLLKSGAGDAPFPPEWLHQPISDELAKNAKLVFREGQKEFDKLEMPVSAETCREILERLETKQETVQFGWLMDQCGNIQKIIEKEMKGKLFLYIPPDKYKFLKTVPPMGEPMRKAFPSTYFDSFEAGACLMTSRPTAAVFHLMRVLETGLAALGKKFDVSLAHTNWNPALEQIESKIREMHRDPAWKATPDCKEQQEYFAQAASHFGILKDAWRNHTMHVRGKYTEEEAERIFYSVKAFMEKLAERLSE